MSVFRMAVAFGAGALVMYLFDPVTGRRRRALAQDQAVAAGHDAERLARAKAKRAVDHVRGAAAEARARSSAEPIDDDRLHARIRARMGHLVDRPGEVEVEVQNGYVVLSGEVKASEVDELIDEVSAMQGVEDVESRLTTGRASQAPAGQVSQH